MDQGILAALKESFYFGGLSEDVLKALAQIACVKTYSKGSHLFFEGDHAQGFFLIIEGLVRIYKISPKGKEQTVNIWGRGEVFAEIVLAGMDTFPAYAQAISPLKVAFFERKAFLSAIEKNPDLALRIIGILAGRIRELLMKIEQFTLKEASERLLFYLWKISCEGEKNPITLSLSKVHIAHLLGVAPETLSRLFQRFKEEGLLELSGKKIWLKNTSRWKELLSKSL